MRKFTKKEIKLLKKYWKTFQQAENEFLTHINILEDQMSDELGITDLEFFRSANGYCGIGNIARSIKLLHSYELDEE